MVPGDYIVKKEILNLLKGRSCKDCCMGCGGMDWVMICSMWESSESYRKRMEVLMSEKTN